ncbi:exopolysaccharide biosynthesis protein [Phenylobacterium sp.]|jgi:hypothetical protein|uniref:exopolysaccharide biosynthesis protein n=1 Tax=Phenylobacterium sp. TaxID=1871053 RepID=UPI0037831AD7
MADDEPKNLEDLLSKLDRAADSKGAKVSVGEIMETVGKRSFGPLLLLTGLLGMTPVSAVPTAPTIIATITFLVAVQLLFGREAVWIPRALEKLSLKAERVRKAASISRRPARLVDRLVKPRLSILTRPWADRMVAAVCILAALATPPLELLPFVAFVPALAVATFGLALVARDGLLVLIALVIVAGGLGFGGYHLLAGG